MSDRLPELLGEFLASRRHWRPEGKAVTIRIDESGDPSLAGRRITGTIVAVNERSGDRLPEAEIALATLLSFRTSSGAENVSTIVAAPHFRHHSWPRLLVTTIQATVTTASLSDTDDRKQLKTFALATVRLIP